MTHTTAMNHSHTQRHDHDQGRKHSTASEDDARHDRIGRREFLLAGGAAGTALLAGCSGGQSNGGPPPDPVPISENAECDVCGMVISEHPGPNGQIFYRENSPERHDNPARFDSTKACLFPYYFEHEQRGWTAEAVYVTDYSRIDYEISVVEGQQYIQTAMAPETFSNAADVVFVVGSDVHGAMGADFIPFSDADEGTAFADEFGGRTVTMDDITPKMLGR
ncbi:nitrous oxide reductase accessory protein NosL [Haloplanus aerogenes]|nr:nitrous oxide reductase accessory protein NosL [Haloplanus aerogenes]